MFKILFFDIDNTLLSFDEYVKDSMRTGFPQFGIGRYEAWMFETFRTINNGFWEALERGELTFADIQRERWNAIFQALGYSFDGVFFEKWFSERLIDSAIPEKDALDVLEYLSQKYILCAASNGPYTQQVNRLTISGMLPHFSQLFISEDIGFSKPSSAFFDVCMERLCAAGVDVPPEEILMIGDSLTSDISGCNAYGMKTCWFNPHRKAVPEGIGVDYEIAQLRDLFRIL